MLGSRHLMLAAMATMMHSGASATPFRSEKALDGHVVHDYPEPTPEQIEAIREERRRRKAENFAKRQPKR